MINLLPTSAVANANLASLKHRITIVTTVVLVGYILLLAGLAGRSWYLANRTATVSAQIASLTSQVGQLAEVEAVLRQQDDRLKLIDQVLKDRKGLTQIASILGAADVTDWKSLFTVDNQDVVVVGSDSASLENYAINLQNSFSSVTIKTLSRSAIDQWKMQLSLAGSDVP